MSHDTPPHRAHAIAFIKHTTPEDYIFSINAASELECQRFVQRVRVELSRMRRYVRDQGMVVKPFRMKLVEISLCAIQTATGGNYQITLRKDAPDAQIARDVANVFTEITNGEALK